MNPKQCSSPHIVIAIMIVEKKQIRMKTSHCFLGFWKFPSSCCPSPPWSCSRHQSSCVLWRERNGVISGIMMNLISTQQVETPGIVCGDPKGKISQYDCWTEKRSQFSWILDIYFSVLSFSILILFSIPPRRLPVKKMRSDSIVISHYLWILEDSVKSWFLFMFLPKASSRLVFSADSLFGYNRSLSYPNQCVERQPNLSKLSCSSVFFTMLFFSAPTSFAVLSSVNS